MKKRQVLEAGCLACGEAITNPICPACLLKEMAEWAAAEHEECVPAIEELAVAVQTQGNELARCILCGKKINRCTYCISADMLEELKEKWPGCTEDFTERFGPDILPFAG